jgi:hypothetical protein
MTLLSLLLACISDVPHRIGRFDRVLAHLAERRGALLRRGRQMMDWYGRSTAWA